MRFEVLGSLRVVDDDGSTVDVGGGRQRRLLAALLVNRGSVVSDERLTDMVWSEDDPPEGGVRALRTVLSRLRGSMHERGAGLIVTRPPGYVIERHTFDTDSDEFERHVAAAVRLVEGGEPARAIESIDAALALWRGEPYAEFADDEWCQVERVRLDELRTTALEVRAESLLSVGDVRQAVIELDGLVSRFPFRERLHRLYATALYRIGRHTDAIRHCQRYRDLLADELGLDPSAEMRALELQILNQSPDLAGPSATTERLKSYELFDRIGSGSWGVVWRARQPSIEREVAIKVVNPEVANQPVFIARFETEARVVAALEHPHVLPVYDFWRDPTGAYLVTRLMRGGSAADRLRTTGAWDVPSVTTLVEQIGAALAATHDSGVLHRDVKPSNILLDGAGNFLLSDFGIALERDHVGPVAVGTAVHTAPEQRDGGLAGPSGDVYGLAVTAWELLAGVPSSMSPGASGLVPLQPRRPDVPPQLDVPLRRATATDPSARYADVRDFVDAFVVAAGATPRSYGVIRDAMPTIESSERRRAANPYKGMRPFGVEDAPHFHGRDDAALLVIDALAGSPFCAVVGPSGAGKSSLVAAGVVPAIRRGELRGSDRWFITTMTPGADPFRSLEGALLRIAADAPASLAEQLASGSEQFVRSVNHVVGTDHALLVIDQFEELYTQCQPEVVTRFAAGIAAAVRDPAQRMHVLVTLRADFFDRPLGDVDLASLFHAATVPLGSMSAASLELAITAPASEVGSVVDPALVAAMIRDSDGQPAVLPLVQYMLTELFDRDAGTVLTHQAYESLGGLGGVVGQRAEAIVGELGPEGALATRRIFGRLVSLGDGAPDTRRRVRRSDLVSPGDELAGRVLDRFGAGRLFVFDHDPVTREPTVEIAHEALLSCWPRLRAWLDDDRDLLRVVSRVSAACTAWEAGAQQEADLLRGGRLVDAVAVTQDAPDRLSDLERRFVDASTRAAEAEQNRQRRSRHRLAIALAVSMAMLAAAVVAGTLAVRASERADQTAFEAQTLYLVSESGRLAERDPDTAMLLAIEARKREQSVATLGAIQRVYARKPHAWLGTMWLGPVFDLAFFHDGSLLTAGLELELWDMSTREQRWAIPTVFSAVAVSADGRVVAAVNGDGYAVLDPATGKRLAGQAIAIESPVNAIALSADGTRLALGTEAGTAYIVDITDGRLAEVDVPPLTVGDDPVVVESIAFSGDGRRLAFTGQSGVGAVLWDVDEQRQIGGSLRAQPSNSRDAGGPGGVLFDGSTLWVASTYLRAFDSLTGAPLTEPNRLGDEFDGDVQDVALAVDDRSLFMLSAAGAAVVDRSSGSVRPLPFEPQIKLATKIDGRHRIGARATLDGVELWALDEVGIGVASATPRVRNESAFAHISTDGSLLVSSTDTISVAEADRPADRSGAGTLWRIDGAAPEQLTALTSPGDAGLRVAGDAVVRIARSSNAAERATVSVWDPATGTFVAFPPIPNRLWAWTVGANDAYVAIGWVDGSFDVFDRRERSSIGHFTLPFDALSPGETSIVTLTFSPDGRRLIATTGTDGVAIYDTTTWTIVDTLAQTVRGNEVEGKGFQYLVYTPDGRFAVTYSAFQGLDVRDPSTFDVIRGIPSETLTFFLTRALDISADGSMIIVQSIDGPRLYDFATLEPIGDPYPHEAWSAEGPSATYAHDVDRLATNVGASVVVHDVDPDMWESNACLLAGRNLSRAEWTHYGFTEPYRLTCPQWGEPAGRIGQTTA